MNAARKLSLSPELLNDTIIRSESLYRKNAKDRFTLEYRVAREGVPIYG